MNAVEVIALPDHPGCSGKWRFPSAHRAWKIVKRKNRRKRMTDEMPLQAYRCRFCGHYHVGHKERGL
jgi:hypothetical protein